MICIPVAAPDNAEMAALLRRASAEPADLHELRLDALTEPPRVEELLAASSRPVIATCSSRREGGGFDGDDRARREILLRAARAGAAFIDAEAGDVPHLTQRGGAKLMVSIHDHAGMPDDLEARVRGMAALPADWVKFAVTARRPADNLRVFAAIAVCPKPCVGIAMGETGLMSRILGPAYGSRIAFGSLERGRETASGQPTARELAELYRVRDITPDTPVYGVIGNPIAQSPGFRLHNRAYRELGLDAVYISFLAEDAEDFLATIPAGIHLCGLSVTIPHKRSALTWADSASEAARRIGAANTLTLRDGAWRADNTDCLAIFESIKAAAAGRGVELADSRALVLGAGGTSRAMGVALMLLGCRVTVSSRNPDRARAVAGEMGWEAIAWEDAWRGEWRVVANTTPVGMYPESGVSPYPAEGWRAGMVAFDAVHNPAETRFLREAVEAGGLAVSGHDMFVRQAAGQFRLWTGRELPEEVRRSFGG